MGRKGVFWGFCLFVLVVFLCSVSVAFIPNPEVITTYLDENETRITGSIYEISRSSLELGYNASVSVGDVLLINVLDGRYRFGILEISSDRLDILSPDGIKNTLRLNVPAISDVNKDGGFDLIFELMSIEEEVAEIEIKLYEDVIPENVTYDELFDIELELRNDIIYDPTDLEMYVKFINFGEGPSHIQIRYTIKDLDGKVYYTGIDDEVVYTEESLVKNLGFVGLGVGDYILTSEIFYGKDQTAVSEKSFRVEGRRAQSSSVRRFIVYFFFVVVVMLVFLYYRKTRREKKVLRKEEIKVEKV